MSSIQQNCFATIFRFNTLQCTTYAQLRLRQICVTVILSLVSREKNLRRNFSVVSHYICALLIGRIRASSRYFRIACPSFIGYPIDRRSKHARYICHTHTRLDKFQSVPYLSKFQWYSRQWSSSLLSPVRPEFHPRENPHSHTQNNPSGGPPSLHSERMSVQLSPEKTLTCRVSSPSGTGRSGTCHQPTDYLSLNFMYLFLIYIL